MKKDETFKIEKIMQKKIEIARKNIVEEECLL